MQELKDFKAIKCVILGGERIKILHTYNNFKHYNSFKNDISEYKIYVNSLNDDNTYYINLNRNSRYNLSRYLKALEKESIDISKIITYIVQVRKSGYVFSYGEDIVMI